MTSDTHAAGRAALQQANALGDVLVERDRQDAKWGEQNHSPVAWLAILMEEVGEAAHEICNASIDPYIPEERPFWLAKLRRELIQVAAVAVAAIESLDRNARAALLADAQTGDADATN